MRQISISDEVKSKLNEHIENGRSLKTGDISAKLAWIIKSRSFLMIIDPNLEESPTGILRRAYFDLTQDIEVIEAEDIDEINYDYKVEVRFRSALSTIENLADCIKLAPEAIRGISGKLNPYFFDIPRNDIENLVFVLMPFGEKWSKRIWKSHIKPYVEEIQVSPQLTCKRADDLNGADVLLDIVGAIKAARLVIADITARNPNVFYELGIAHSFGQRVILITQNVDDIPFDLRRFRHIIYQDNSDGYAELRRQLKNAILEILA